MNNSFKSQIGKLPGYILVLLWCIFTFVVIGWIFAASFSTSRDIFSGDMFASGIILENYVKAWFANNVSMYFINSMLYTFSAIAGVLLISAPCAYALSRFVFKGNKIIQNMFISTMGIPSIMIILPLFALFTSLRLTNSRWMLIILYICINVPFTVFFLMAFFRNLSPAFEEAAAIDGCGPIKTFWTIMMPLAQPGIVTVTIFNFITIWNEYFMSMIFASRTELRPVAVGLFTMVQSMRYTGDWAGMFAAVVIVFLPTFILYIFLSEKIIAGVTGGAIKG
ncbi:MAG: carbohydrate ABC transporter permease [Oscillospiraceae bacterium]|nr:carbohydrate ABC transporter permease [Oscillospiraceae bacterium]